MGSDGVWTWRPRGGPPVPTRPPPPPQAVGGWVVETLREGAPDEQVTHVEVVDTVADHVLVVVRRGDADHVEVDGRAHPEFPDIISDSLAVHPATGRTAYVAADGARCCVVVDGAPGPFLTAVSAQARPVFSPDGRHVAYGARPEGRRERDPAVLVVDQEPTGRLLAAAPVQFTPAGALCVVESQPNGRSQRVVVGDTAGPWVDAVLQLDDPMAVVTATRPPGGAVVAARGPGADSVAYAVAVSGGQAVVRDGTIAAVHQRVGRPVFDQTGRHLAYPCWEVRRHGLRRRLIGAVCVDGVTGPEVEELAPVVGFDRSGRVAYLAGAPGAIRLHRDHRPEGDTFSAVWSGVMVTPAGRTWFVVSRSGHAEDTAVVVDGVTGPWAVSVLEASVRESPDARRIGYLVARDLRGGFTDGAGTMLVLDGVVVPNLRADDRCWTRGLGFGPGGCAAVGVAAVDGMQPWVEGLGRGPTVDECAGPWWPSGAVRFVGVSGGRVVGLTRRLA